MQVFHLERGWKGMDELSIWRVGRLSIVQKGQHQSNGGSMAVKNNTYTVAFLRNNMNAPCKKLASILERERHVRFGFFFNSSGEKTVYELEISLYLNVNYIREF